MSEVELREQIAKDVSQALELVRLAPIEYAADIPWGIDRHDIDMITKPLTDQILNLIKAAGYLPVEPAQLEVLGDEEIDNLARVSRYYVGQSEIKTFTGCVKGILQATIDHNEAKGQLYRTKSETVEDVIEGEVINE